MKKHLIAACVLCAAIANVAFAHTPLDKTAPVNGAQLAKAPAEISLVFKRNIRITKVTATMNGQAPTQLDLSGQSKFATEFALPFPDKRSGEYTIEWRGLADDGHAQKGIFSFTVSE